MSIIQSQTPARYSIPTGHPPVAEQLRHQLRCTTGARYLPASRRTVDTEAVADRPDPDDDVDCAPHQRPLLADRVLVLLTQLARQGGTLPALPDMATRLGCANVSVNVALQRLTERGDIGMWIGHTHAWRGERVIRIRATGAFLRTGGAPLHITP